MSWLVVTTAVTFAVCLAYRSGRRVGYRQGEIDARRRWRFRRFDEAAWVARFDRIDP